MYAGGGVLLHLAGKERGIPATVMTATTTGIPTAIARPTPFPDPHSGVHFRELWTLWRDVSLHSSVLGLTWRVDTQNVLQGARHAIWGSCQEF